MGLKDRPNLVNDVSQLGARVAGLERPYGQETMTPARMADAAQVTQLTAGPVYVAVGTGRGSEVSWMVITQPGSGTTVHLRLRDGKGNAGPTVSATSKGAINVSLPLTNWLAGETRLVYLDAWVDTGVATILPIRAVSG
jgi:hypothetical protein